MNTLLKVLTAHWLEDKVDYNLNMQTKELVYSNGSKILFVPLKQQPSDPEFNWLWGYEITYAFVDEAQQVSSKALSIISSRFTEKIKEYNLVGKTVMGCNPDKWHLYSRYIAPQKKEGGKEELYNDGAVFIQSLYKDNPYIDHEKYEASLANADNVTRQRLLYGNWDYDDTAGKLFEYAEIVDLFEVIPEGSDERFISVDVARLGKDNTVITVREGMECWEIIRQQWRTTDQTAKRIKELEKDYGVPRWNIVIDVDWVWWWVADQVRWCVQFNNNGRPIDTGDIHNFANLKAQCYFELKRIIEKRLAKVNADGIIREKLSQELSNIRLKNEDTDNKIQLESKEEMKKRMGRSPDIADSIMMRMYFEVAGIGNDSNMWGVYSIDVGNFLLGR